MVEPRYEDKRLMDRMRRKVDLENLWYEILKITSKKPMYGYEIRKIIKKSLGFWLGNVTAYKVLYDLERRGYVKAEEKTYRKRYSITAKGKKEFIDTRKFLHSK
jgi:DNA-binding PadR family transcriptional regulator